MEGTTVCQGSPELRALAAKLEQAYINKERSAQVAERKLAGREEELQRQREQEELMLEMQILEERERRELVEEQCTKIRYQKQLDEQVKVQETEKEKVVQQFLKEKEMIDEVVRKIQRENEAMTLKRMMDKKATKEQVEEFKKSQEVWTKLEDDKIRRENEEIAKFSQRKEFGENWRRIKSEGRMKRLQSSVR